MFNLFKPRYKVIEHLPKLFTVQYKKSFLYDWVYIDPSNLAIYFFLSISYYVISIEKAKEIIEAHRNQESPIHFIKRVVYETN